jgi:glucose/arabinose dehydrogenase
MLVGMRASGRLGSGVLRRWLVAVVVVAAVGALVGGVTWWRGWLTTPSVNGAPEVDAVATTVASGLSVPWGLAFLPDGSALVTERDTTRIVRVAADGSVREEQRVTEAQPRGEGGLLGIAVSPSYASDGLVYVYYTTATDNRVARMKLGESPQPILTGIPRAGNHNGGRIAFGPAGFLYVGTGDGAEPGHAQDRTSLGGKILRITPDGRPAAGNPFGDSPVWSMGHRNVQGLSWDASGQLYATEFGQNRYDELNRIEAGKNYGWPEVEGRGDDRRYVNPIATFATSDASPSGLVVVGDHAYLACLRGEKVYRLGTDGSRPQVLLAGRYGRIRHVGRAPDGSLWILTSNRDGRGDPEDEDDRILRMTPP